MESSISHESFERNMEEIVRKYGNSANCNLRTSTRQPPIHNEHKAQASTDSHSSSPNQTRLLTPKTNLATCPSVASRIVKVRAEKELKAAAIRQYQDYAENKAF